MPDVLSYVHVEGKGDEQPMCRDINAVDTLFIVDATKELYLDT
jgi:hypothetical protein